MVKSLEMFISEMNQIRKYNYQYDNANKGLELITGSNQCPIEVGAFLLDAYITLLEEKYEVKDTWIQYYVWDCEMGLKKMEIYIDDIPIDLDSDEKLYTLITGGYGVNIK